MIFLSNEATGALVSVAPERGGLVTAFDVGVDGAVLYQMKRRFSDGTQTLRFVPQEFLLRLCRRRAFGGTSFSYAKRPSTSAPFGLSSFKFY